MSGCTISTDSCQNCKSEIIESKTSPTRNVPSGKKKIGVNRLNQIPDSILNDVSLLEAIKILPSNYNFEIYKSIWRIQQEKHKIVALQFPEGLLMYACIIGDILQKFCDEVDIIIMGDVTYGACCIDDFTAVKLGATFLIHYGHSCLVPTNNLSIKVLYVFVEILFDSSHLINIVHKEFPPETRIALMGTIQFNSALYEVHMKLKETHPNVSIPQNKPLSQGETLGCTSPLISDSDILIFIADGRFHLEAAMIQNPHIPAYRYDPYSKEMTSEAYDINTMKQVRLDSIIKARNSKVFGLILGTLGRQGNVLIFNRIQKLISDNGCMVIPFLMAEINPTKLSQIDEIEVWVQVACPRLSIDWGKGFNKPLLTPYELEVALGSTAWKDNYPMDYYSSSGGPWSNIHNRLSANNTANTK